MVNSISISELLKILDKINIIDTRSIEKYNDNHIPNARSIPSEQLMLNPNKYLDWNQTYYIYCQKGITSSKICQILKIKGFKIINIIGGYESWLLEK